jgi:DNA-directed RNA polymerase sigma subunit (sigma70/sigma32)
MRRGASLLYAAAPHAKAFRKVRLWRRRKVREMYAEGRALKQIGQYFGISKQRVQQILDARPPQTVTAQNNLFARRCHEILDMRAAGHTLKQIGQHFGVTRER